MTRTDLLARIATATGHRRKAERIADAETADAVIDAVVEMLRGEPFVLNAWGGTEFLAKLTALKDGPARPLAARQNDDVSKNGDSHGSL